MSKPLGHLAYLEITSPDVDASTAFYVERFGLRVVDRVDGSVYLRCWGDYYRYSLVIRQGAEPGLANMAWRTGSDADLDALVARIEAKGGARDGVWADSGVATGRQYSFVGPYGHRMTLLWEIEEYVADPEHASIYPDRPEKRSSHAASPRFLDHVTIASTDVEGFAQWYSDALGFRIMARTLLEETPLNVFTVLTTNEKSHDLGIVFDNSGVDGRVHHIAFWVDQPEDLARTADIMLENGVRVEYGPSIHGIGEQHYLYLREPSTLRVEVNSGGYRNYVPDWRPRTWTPSQGSNNFYMNTNPPLSMMEAFPHADGLTATEDGASPELATQLRNPWSSTTSASTQE